MSDLFWPGDGRAGELFTDAAFRAALVAVESAWVDTELSVPADELDVEAGGNPVIPLLDALRKANPEVALHEGLTSQDVLDSALMLLLRDAVAAVVRHLGRAAEALTRLTAEHGDTAMTGRTLTQAALPITFGDKVAAWRGSRSARSRSGWAPSRCRSTTTSPTRTRSSTAWSTWSSRRSSCPSPRVAGARR
jgi:3-carboxy-cis,cis-muconate cycloisomerase